MADKKLESLDDLFELQLKDLYSAETQGLQAMPLIAQAAKDPMLRKNLEQHLVESQAQVERLQQIAKNLEINLGGHTCKAMQGLISEGKETLSENATDEVQDAALIAAQQRIEHYEIAGYGTAAHYAERLGHNDAATLLRQTLQEEQNADTKLNDLAKSSINQKAE
jgi:ferritin-like metal-binding protein YciE